MVNFLKMSCSATRHSNFPSQVALGTNQLQLQRILNV